MNAPLRISAAVILLAALAGCATVPPGPPSEVVRLENELDRLHNDARVAPNAPDELRDADAAVAVLAHEARRMDAVVYEHRVYVADRLVQTAEAQGLSRFAEMQASNLGAERDRLIVDARNRELRDVRAEADAARAAAEAERRNAELARRDASESRAEIDSLRSDLSELQAQQTQRGLMVTLGDFLFETDRAELKPGAEHTLDGIVRALRDDPVATVEVDGHTDSTGSRDYNVELSRDRAQAVKDYLTGRGVEAARVTTRGLGPDYPVASNSTDAGRLQNRRVEVLVQTQVARLNRDRATRE